MFTRAVWTVAIALLTVGLGFISTQAAADEPFGPNLTPVTLAAVVQPSAAAPKRITPAGPYTPYKRIAKCQGVFAACGGDADCCSHVCCPRKVCELDRADCR